MKIESAIKWLSPKTSPALIHSIEIGGGNPMKYINEAIATVERHFGKCAKMNVMLEDGAYMPERAHEADAGYDLRTPEDFVLQKSVFNPIVNGLSYVTIDTGVHVEIPEGYVGMLKSKSGLNVRDDIIGEGVIDSGYTGSIKVKLYNLGGNTKIFKRGDKIIQLVIMPIITPELEEVDEFEDTDRGDNGFGSTGR